jgi:isopenicillin N synthase-like dioxygenase
MLLLGTIMLCLCTAVSSAESPPVAVIDISVLYDETATPANSGAYRACAEQIDAALSGEGLFAVTGHRLTDAPSTQGLEAAKTLFRYDREELHRVQVKSSPPTTTTATTGEVRSEAMRGYISFGAESGLLGKYFEAKEGFSYGFGAHHISEDEAAKDSASSGGDTCSGCARTPLHGENIWPAAPCAASEADEQGACLASHRQTIAALETVFSGTVGIAQVLSRAIASLNTERLTALLASCTGDGIDQLGMRGHLEAQLARWANVDDLLRCGDEISITRLFHYNNIDKLAAAADAASTVAVDGVLSSELGSSPHTDWGFLTVILQDSVGGLQFLHSRRGEWTDVPAIDGAIVINGGDYLSLYSGGRYHSPIHRVLAPRGQNPDRYSFVLFFYPNYYSEIPTETTTVSAGEVEEHNTLLGGEAASVSFFGDYMVEKWRGVFKGADKY